MILAERVRAACVSRGISQAELARRGGLTPQHLDSIFRGKTGKSKHLPKLAVIVCVDVTWLTTGDRLRAPTWWVSPNAEAERLSDTVQQQLTEGAKTGAELAVIGSVAAGDGKVDAWVADEGFLKFPQSWVAVKITGNSAYPVAYPGQFAVVDLDRAATPATLDRAALVDLHDNLCLIQTIEHGTPHAYLKRFCHEPRAPQAFVCASVDSGRASPYIPLATIVLIAPVVSIIFEDPREPRKKGRNRANVTLPTP